MLNHDRLPAYFPASLPPPDDHTPGTPKVQLVTESLPLPLDPSLALIRVHAVALKYRDVNIANGGNPWPVISHGVLCNDASRVFSSRGAGMKDVLTASRFEKLERIGRKFVSSSLVTANYVRNPEWHDEVLGLTDSVGVDLAVDFGCSSSRIKSMKCTRRGRLSQQAGSRGINAGSNIDMKDLCAALSAICIHFDDIIDSIKPVEEADEAIGYTWQGKQVGVVMHRL